MINPYTTKHPADPQYFVNRAEFEKAHPKISHHLARERFEGDFATASPAEQRLLVAMARLTPVFSPSELSQNGSRVYLKGLVENKQLVVKNSRGMYSLYHPLFKEYLKARA